MIFKDKDLNKKELLKKLSEIVDQQTFLSFFRDSNVITFDNEIVYLILQTNCYENLFLQFSFKHW